MKKTESKLQELALTDNLKYLNDMTLDNKVFPQIQMKLPKVIQIRLSLNKHENISYFDDVAIPSILLIDENDVPIFCFRCDMKHFNYNFKSKNVVQRLENIDTDYFMDDKKKKGLLQEKTNKNSVKLLNENQNRDSIKEQEVEKEVEMEIEEPKQKPKLIPNLSINPALLENIR